LIPLLCFLVFFPVVMWIPGPLAELFGVDVVWTLLIAGVVLLTPIVLYESRVHRPAVNAEMEKLIAERGTAPSRASAASRDNSNAPGELPSGS
jgi:membrane protease YdiL (CAAX protease family)